MTADRQRSANRRNAQRSTGPRSASGKMRSSQNAVGHGLSVPASQHPSYADALETLTTLLLGPSSADLQHREIARTLAAAEIDLARVRYARVLILAEMDKVSQGRDQGGSEDGSQAAGDPIREIDDRHGFKLSSLVSTLQATLPSKQFETFHARLKRNAVALLKRPARKPVTVADLALRLHKLTRYQLRALQRRRSALRALHAMGKP